MMHLVIICLPDMIACKDLGVQGPGDTFSGMAIGISCKGDGKLPTSIRLSAL